MVVSCFELELDVIRLELLFGRVEGEGEEEEREKWEGEEEVAKYFWTKVDWMIY